MSDTHTPVNEEVEVTLKLKVKFINASYYDQLTQTDLNERLELAKAKIKDELLNMVVDEYYLQPLVSQVRLDYQVTNAEV